MKGFRFNCNNRLVTLAGAVAITLCSGASASSPMTPLSLMRNAPAIAAMADAEAPEVMSHNAPLADEQGRANYTVAFKEPPLSMYSGNNPAFTSIPKMRTAGHTNRIDVKSAEAVSYVTHLERAQNMFVSDLSAQLARSVEVVAQYQHALNGVVLKLTEDEAAALRERDDVLLVDRERTFKPVTFATPTLIGADRMWYDTSAPNGIGYEGEGIVIGEIDSGINYLSTSFKAAGDDGYTPYNPLGSGTYLGQCRTGRGDAGHCNDKLIGMYNLDSATTSATGRDIDGHGSHTASTAGGNFTYGASFAGGTFNVSGIAPHANIIAYMACGSCSSSALTGAVNQAVADGIVDVINYSIGGPNDGPWLDPIDQAFLGAANAGIFVAVSAGNSGPGDATTDAYAPWYTTVGATTPNSLPGFALTAQGWSGTGAMVSGAAPLPTQAFATLPIIESPNFADGANDGCSAYPANYFRRPQTASGAQSIAVLRLDQNGSNCGSSVRRTAAATAGAIAVLYVDPEYINLGASGASYSLLSEDWNALKAAIGDVSGSTGTAVASISYPTSPTPRAGDRLTGFSSRGPTLFGTLKPDISAPGDIILAALSPTAASGYSGTAATTVTPYLYGTESGTSMASPHIAGSAALVRQAHRDWTPMEVKSALMTTAKSGLTLGNGTTPATPNQAGAGRVDLTKAYRVGLVFDENGTNFQAANPAIGGKPETLNIASYYHADCVDSCVFPRTVRSTGKAATWTVAVTGLPAGSYSLSKTSFDLDVSGNTSYTLTIDTSSLTKGQWYYGDLSLTPSYATAADTIFKDDFEGGDNVLTQHLPIAIRPATAKLAADTSAIAKTVTAGQSTTQNVVISNAGNPTLNWSITPYGGFLKGTAAKRKPSTNGLQDRTVVTSTTTTAIESTNTSNAYGADWFDIYGDGTTLAELQMDGFGCAGSNCASGYPALNTFATQLAWRVWADNNGAPNGRPGKTIAGDQDPVFQFPAAAGGLPATGAGMSYPGDGVRINLAAAGATPPSMTAGRYWLNVAPSISGTGTVFYQLLTQESGKTPAGQYALPNNSNASNKAWRPTTTSSLGGAGYTGYSMEVVVNAACGAPWLSYSVSSGSLGLGGNQTVTTTINATGLSAGTYKAYMCISGNGTSPPFMGSGSDSLLLPVTLTVQPVPSYTVTPSVGTPSGSISPGSAQTVTSGATTQFMLTPDAGYHIDTVGGTCGGSLSGSTFTTNAVTANCSVIANFAQDAVVTHQVTPSVGTPSGSISPNTIQTVNDGVTTQFTLTADAGYHIDTVGGTCGGNLSGNLFTTTAVTADCSVIANFAQDVVIVAPTLKASFAPNTHVGSGISSTLTLTLGNANATPATLSADLVDNLPANVVVAATPNAATTCPGGTVTASAAAATFNLGSGAQIPANGSCTVTVDVSSSTAGVYTNTLSAGALQTDAGSNTAAASDKLVVAGTFPAPYCPATFTSGIEPVSRVIFSGIDNTSATTSTTAMDNFLGVAAAQVAPRGGYSISVRGNTVGNYTDYLSVYFDWNHDGMFSENSNERTPIGSITNSNGNATTSTPATSLVIVPPNAKPGLTRMRVVKAYGNYGKACGENGYGQTEDYLVNVDPSLTPPPTPALVSKSFNPDYVTAGAGGISTLTIALVNYNSSPMALTADFKDTFPAGLVVAPTPNASTTCIGGSVVANAGDGSVTLPSGSQIPSDVGCTVSVDVTTATGGIYINTIPPGAIQTANGGNPSAAAATVQFASATPNYQVGFEASEGFNGSAAGTNINGQVGWGSNSTYGVVTTTTPKTGSQVARLTSTSSGGTSGSSNNPLIISPDIPPGTSPYSMLSADVMITATTNGASWNLNPQDGSAGLVTTLLRFNRSTTPANRTITVADFDQGSYVNTGATWTAGTYFNIKYIVERATGALTICVDGSQIYSAPNGNSTGGPNITDVVVSQLAGTTGQTANNYIYVDNVTIDNPTTASCSGSNAPAVTHGTPHALQRTPSDMTVISRPSPSKAN